jgi:predicted ATPase
LRFGKNGYDLRLEPTADDNFTISLENLYFNGPYFGESAPNLGSGHNESNLKKEMHSGNSSNIATFCYQAISNWKIFHFHDTSATAGVKLPGSLHDNEYLRPDASNLAAYLYHLKAQSPTAYEQICKTIRLALPLFDEFILKPITLDSGEEQIRLLWKKQDSDYTLWPSQLSDGSIRFICLVTALLQPKPPSTIIIDEPELGLHPYAITLLGSLIRAASLRTQVVISTQSVPLLNEFSIEDLIIVENQNAGSHFKRLSKNQFDQWLKDYSLGELWEKNILGGRPSK